MSFNTNTLGRRLREARENCGLSQQVAADSIGIRRTALTQLEAGNRAVSTLELAQLAELYKRPVAEFSGEQPLHEDDLLVALHRLAPGLDTHSDIKEHVERCLSLCREGCSLEKLLGRSPRSGPPAYNLPAPRTASEAVRQGEQVALQERKRLGLGQTPIANLEHQRLPEDLMDELARLKISLVGLPPDAAHEVPSQLSGGMRKRAGIARALALDPEILFLDEPTSGLDPLGAAAFDELIVTLKQSLDLTVFLVTHDLDSIFTCCDRLAVLVDKHVVAVDTPARISEHPHPWIQACFRGPRGRSAEHALGLRAQGA